MAHFPFNEDHDMIRDVVKGWLKDWDDYGQKQHVIAKSGQAYDPDGWKTFAQEQGMAGISIAEEYGGAGLGHLGRAVVMEETGYVLFPSPFFSTCVICADIIETFGTEDVKSDWLGRIAAGEAILSFVDARSLPTDNGEVKLVLDAQFADMLLIALPSDTGTSKIVMASPDADGITVTPSETVDPMRALASVTLNGFAPKTNDVLGAVDNADLDKVLTIAYGALAAECVGGSQRCLDMTLDYAEQRIQFDRPIASFQAVKHRCADMFINLEAARSAAYYAADSDNTDERLEAYLIAKPYASEAYFSIAADAIQMHGGIGFTWEYPLHYFFKRARANKSLFNSVEDSYDRLATLIRQGAA
ncbi:MAG: acyl-CoA dehydrogenase family protein [Parvibaculales bacterium]